MQIDTDADRMVKPYLARDIIAKVFQNRGSDIIHYATNQEDNELDLYGSGLP